MSIIWVLSGLSVQKDLDMTEPDLSFIRPDVSLEEMRALDRRRLMAIVNGMIMRMSEWLGEVAKKGEEGLMRAEKRLDKAEVKLRLIETKLQGISIDELEKKMVVTVVEEKKSMVEKTTIEEYKSEETKEVKDEEKKELVEEVKDNDNRLLIKDDPRYSKYFKMVKMGIQEEAVRLKMKSEGIDPSILDTPNVVSNDQVEGNGEDSSDESVGSFTDSE